jgi:preprotein translocase subunit SecD
LGLAEPVVARLGFDHILVQVPGARDPAQVRRILTSTATVQWHLEDTSVDAAALTRGGSVPSGSMLRADAEGRPVALYREMIVSGEQLDDATFMYVEGKPVVSIELDAAGAQRMLDVTQRNVGRPLAVLLIEETRPPPTATEETPRARTANVEARSAAMPSDGANARARRDETVIFVGRIANVFSSTFQLTGLGAVEAQDLAILLRSGALAAPIYEVQHGAVSPTLGQDNIDRGRTALVVGFVSVIAFMAGYYRGFGWIANLALVANLALMIGTLSVLPAALTLPGLAGIVLTVGMAVDANVLIFERIRESLAAGTSPRAAIDEGYRRAFATIADANVTTLIAAIGLFAFGSGPILGFAVTLGLGIVTSMFTAVVGTRVVVDLVYSRRRPARLSIGRVRMPEAREPADD